MFHILGIILKITGMILLTLLSVLIGLLFLVLFVPVRYKGRGSYEKELTGKLRITWLFHCISVKISYQEKLEMAVRILGIRIGNRKEKKERNFSDKTADGDLEEEPLLSIQETGDFSENQKETEMSDDGTSDITVLENKAERKPEEKSENGQIQPEITKQFQNVGRSEEILAESGETNEKKERTEEAEKTERKAGIREKLKGFFEKIPAQIKKVFQKIKNLQKKLLEIAKKIRKIIVHLVENWEKAVAFIEDEENQKTFVLVKKQLKRVIVHLFPKISGQVVFGFDDPYITGLILTWASLFYPLYGRTFLIEPSFEQEIFEGTVKIKGRIRIGTLLFAALRLWCNRNFRKNIKKLLK